MNTFIELALSPLPDTKDFKGKGQSYRLQQAQQALAEAVAKMKQLALVSEQYKHLFFQLRIYAYQDNATSRQVAIPQLRWRSAIAPRPFIDFTTVRLQMVGMPIAIQDKVIEIECQRIVLMTAARIARHAVMLMRKERQQIHALLLNKPIKSIVAATGEINYKMQQQNSLSL